MATSGKTSPPIPKPDPLTAGYWKAAAERQLAIQQCVRCARFSHPPARICPGCQSVDFQWTNVSGRGQISHRTIIPAGMSRVQGFEGADAFAIIVVELAEQDGLSVVANFRGGPAEAAVIGLSVEVMFEDLGNGVVLPQFRAAVAGT